MSTLRCLLVAALVLGLSPLARSAPPNVVMIISDDQGWTDFGFMEHKVIKTPRLDKLASESALFPNGYVPSSLCRASLATLLTGLFGHQHKICCNDPPDGVDRAKMHPFIKEAPALPRLLAKAGYRSLQTGKFWEGHYENAGFTSGMTVKGRHGDDGLAIGRKTMKPIYDFIEAEPDKPFFLWYAPMMPHSPHNPPEKYLAKYKDKVKDLEVAKYYAMCEWFDDTCGELLDYLDKKKLSDNTLVVFVVDNGWIQSEKSPNYAPKSKRSPYDGGLRTPIMLRWPGHIKPMKYDELVSTVDLAPTILQACGVKVPEQLPGISLLPLAEGKAKLDRKQIFGEIFEHTAINIEQPAVNLTHRWVRQGDWKLILPQKGKPELYNIAQDPMETKDQAAAQPDKVQELTALIDKWWAGK
ncbi:MAG: sulfatase [Gemmataceae bacterium]